MTTYIRRYPTYKETLELARQLSLRDQRRLRAELAKLSDVKLVSPNKTATALRAGRTLASKIRKELQAAKMGSLDETMRQLRGQAW